MPRYFGKKLVDGNREESKKKKKRVEKKSKKVISQTCVEFD